MSASSTAAAARVLARRAAHCWVLLAPLVLVLAQAGRPRPGGWAAASHLGVLLVGLVVLPTPRLVGLLVLLGLSLLSPLLSGAAPARVVLRLLAGLLVLPVGVLVVRPLHHVSGTRLRRRLREQHREALTLRGVRAGR